MTITSRTLVIAGSVASFGFSAVVRVPGFLGIDAPEGNLLAILSLLAVVLGAVTFLYVLREAWRGNLSLRLVIGLALGYAIVTLLLPLPTSGDVYSYAFYGRIMGIYDANPYVATPSMFSFDPMYPGVPTAWVSTPSVYGPVFSLMSGALAKGIREADALVFAYRAIAVSASLAVTFLVAALAKRILPERAPFAVAAVALNPVVLFDTVATAHNDVLVGLAVAGALWFVTVRKELAATALLTAGMLIKASAAIPLFLFVATVVACRGSGGRLKSLGSHAAVAGGLTLLTAAPFLQSTNPTLGIAELATHRATPAASTVVQNQVDSVVCRVGLCSLTSWAEVGVRIGFALLLAAGLFVIVRSLIRRPGEPSPVVHGAAWGWGLLLLTLCSPVLLPWYAVWTLPLAWLLPRVPRLALIATSVAVSFTIVIDDPSRFPDVADLIIWIERVASLAVAAIVVLVAWELIRRGPNGTLLNLDRAHLSIARATAVDRQRETERTQLVRS